MAALLPAITRMAALQQDCSAILPAMFDACSVIQFEAGQLVLSTPNAALAAKLKQQLPKLQEALLQRGWQVNAIRIKVQVRKLVEKAKPVKQLKLPPQAVSALASLTEALDDSPRNQALKDALSAMVNRHRRAR
ncbi:DciA family protein [Noviherbaspirillum saxi]